MAEKPLRKQYKTFCHIQNLKNIRQFIEASLYKQMSETELYMVVLAVDEVCSNSIIHANALPPHDTLEVSVRLENNTLCVEVCDSGSYYNLACYQEPAIHSLIEKRHKGGLGIMLVNRIMDKIEAIRHNGRNVYRLIKKVNHQ